MKNVCVITGAGSGMGLSAAKLVGQGKKVIIAGRTVAKLENALKELAEAGVEAEAFPCDASDREAVGKLAAYAASQGSVTTVIHAAGVSPTMSKALPLFKINALGTINIDEAFGEVMNDGGVILNVASMSAYMLPDAQRPLQLYQLALTDADAFIGGFEQMLTRIPEQMQTGVAYTMSKNFVCWYTEKMALKYGPKGIRVVSISPGTIDTPMGKAEGEEAAAFANAGPLGRVGQPEEIAQMMAFMCSEGCSYLTGVDILYDGGAVAAYKEQAAQRAAAPQE